MAETVEKFLKKYFKQLHFNSMPPEVRARFFEWVKKDTLTIDMRLWVRDQLKHTATGALAVDPDGNYIPNNEPDPSSDTTLPPEEARELFIVFQNAFAKMDSAKNGFKDKDPQSLAFLQQYFGPGKLFKTSPAKRSCADGIMQMINLIKTNDRIKRIVEEGKFGDKNLFDRGKLDEFIDKCEHGKYDHDGEVQSKAVKVAKLLEHTALEYSGTPVADAIEQVQDSLSNIMAPDAFSMDPASISDTDLRNFRQIYLTLKYTEPGQSGLLTTLYFNKTVRDQFAKHDDGIITNLIEKAEGSINWQDKSKDNYVDPKVDDVLTPLQWLEKKVSDTYADTIKKYEDLRGASVFRRQEAKDIFKAIDKNKIKPQDGLKAILDKKADIEKNLNNPVARQHFKWFTETMEPVAAKMPKAVDGAWRNATQMKAVIGQIILKATDPNNSDPDAIQKAETAMEIMTAMKYGMLTSKVMDAMKQTDFNVFSDGKLSWNKNEGIQFVTKAFDKSVKAAFLGVGYGITFVRNKIMMSGMSFQNKDNQNKSVLAQRFKEENTNKQQALRDENTADQNTISELQGEVSNLSRFTNHNIARRQANIQQILNRTSAEKQAHQADYDRYNQSKQIVDNNNANPGEFSAKHAERTKLKKHIKELEDELNGYTGATDAVSIAKASSLAQQIDAAQQTIDSLTEEMRGLAEEIQQLRQAETDVKNLQNSHDAFEQADKNYNRALERQNEIPSKVTRLNEATQEINELNQAIADRNNALNNWPRQNTNKVLYLENYWNWLQTGVSKTYKFSTNAAQKDFDKNNMNDAMLNQYLSQYSLAA